VPHRHDAYRVDIPIRQQLAVVGVAMLDAETLGQLLQARLAARAERKQLRIREPRQRLAMFFAEPAEADDGVPDLAHCRASFTRTRSPLGKVPIRKIEKD